MPKKAPTLKQRLKAVIEDEKKRFAGEKKKLLKARTDLTSRLRDVESKIAELEQAFDVHVAGALESAGVRVAGAAKKTAKRAKKAAKKAGKKAAVKKAAAKKVAAKAAPASRKKRGSVKSFIVRQFSKNPEMTRAQIIAAGKKAGHKPASVSQALYGLSRTGHIKQVRKIGRESLYAKAK